MARDSISKMETITPAESAGVSEIAEMVQTESTRAVKEADLPTSTLITLNNEKLAGGSYEFRAPQFYDFNNPSSAGGLASESWFEQFHSPANGNQAEMEVKIGNTPQRGSGEQGEESFGAPPPTVTQLRKRVSNGDSNGNNDVGGEANLKRDSSNIEQLTTQLSPQIISAPKRSSDNIFVGELPLALLKSPSHKRPSYDRLFEMRPKEHYPSNASSHKLPVDDDQLAGSNNSYHHQEQQQQQQHQHQQQSDPLEKLGKVRTPDKVKLERLKTAAPLLPTRSTKPLTVPVEFNFSDRTRSKKDDTSFAVPIPLFKTAPDTKTKINQRKITIPESPMLMTKLRTKAVIPSQPINTSEECGDNDYGKKTSDSADSQRRTNRSKITVPIEVKLATSLRLSRSRSAESCGKSDEESRVISTSNFKATILRPEKPTISSSKITIPQSPTITKSAVKKCNVPDYGEQTSQFKARPAPKANEPFHPKYSHSHTQPISPLLPGKAIAEEKRKKFQQAIEQERRAAEEAKTFHATPIPNYEEMRKTGNSTPTIRPLTKPQPFTLVSELRHQQYQEEFQRKIAQEEEKLVSGREFRSRPAPHTAPFHPKKSTRPLTRTLPIHLHSDERAIKRQEFDQHLREKEEEMIRLQKHQDEERRKKEEEEIKKLRKELVPKARPVMHYPPLIIKPADKKLTVPQSPALQTNIRATSRKKYSRNDEE